jgi:hypothetical protein
MSNQPIKGGKSIKTSVVIGLRVNSIRNTAAEKIYRCSM